MSAMQLKVFPPPGPRAFHLMAKPIGATCNLRCDYCFYLDKTRFYDASRSLRMRDEVLEQYVKQYIQSQDVQLISFAWQGGEPTLMGLDFFRKAIELQKKYAAGKTIQNALQTNGTMLDDEWCELLKRESFLVGISIDGPAALHDQYRRGADQEGSFAKVMLGLELLKKHKVEFNTLTVINDVNARHPLEMYEFLKESGSTFWQFIPIVERLQAADGRGVIAPPFAATGHAETSPLANWSVPPKLYGQFLCAIFDRWYQQDIGRIFIQQFESALAPYMGRPPGACVYAETCGAALIIEHNGDVYSCDHFVFPQYKLGNILKTPLADMVFSPQQQRFGQAKLDALPQDCLKCNWRKLCNGGCPKDRFAADSSGGQRLNYLCPGFKTFYNHADGRLRKIVKVLQAQP